MSAGKRYKFTGSSIQFTTGAGSAKTITGISNASPAVVTSVAHGLENGDIVTIAGVVGMTEVNGVTYIIRDVATDTFSLEGTDSTSYGTYASGGTATPGTWSNFCELTGYTRDGGSSPEITATSICSTAAEFELGLPDYGTTKLDYNYAPDVTVQQGLQAAYAATSTVGVKVTLPGSGGTKVQLGYVQQTSEQASNGTLWTGSTTIRNTAEPSYFSAS